jgi:hypothetical protein
MPAQQRIKAGSSAFRRAVGARESTEHAALVKHLQLRLRRGVFFFHVPNGEARSRATAAILVGMGVRRGMPDLGLIKDGRAYFLELKTETGTLSAEQAGLHDELRAAGAVVATAYGLNDQLHILEDWEMLR